MQYQLLKQFGRTDDSRQYLTLAGWVSLDSALMIYIQGFLNQIGLVSLKSKLVYMKARIITHFCM